MTTDPSDIVERLIKIADASRREDGTDIPLGEHLREAAAEIERLRAALAAERERCARVADDEREWALRRKKENVDEKDRDLEHWYEGEAEASERIAATIRAME